MDEFEFRRIIYDYVKEICHYSQMQVFSTSSYQRNYFQLQIDDAMNGLINLFQSYTMERGLNHQFSAALFGQQVQLSPEEQPEPQGMIGQPGQPPQGEQPMPQGTQEETNIAPAREITPQELADSDGSGGKPAYVAVNGTVYDVSMAIRWGGGTHFGLYAGHDLTNEFISCHNSMFDILKILPIVGVYKQ